MASFDGVYGWGEVGYGIFRNINVYKGIIGRIGLIKKKIYKFFRKGK